MSTELDFVANRCDFGTRYIMGAFVQPSLNNPPEVGVKNRAFTLSDITLNGTYTYSCNPITDAISSFTNNYAEPCMDVCHETVKMLRSIEEI
jgi:hypothetical protein